MVAYTSLVLLGASAAIANPLFPRQQNAAITVTVTAAAPASTAWNAGIVSDYPIHASCNATQRAFIQKGLQETVTICKQLATTFFAGVTRHQSTRSILAMQPQASPSGGSARLLMATNRALSSAVTTLMATVA
jgi:hypothetical protein